MGRAWTVLCSCLLAVAVALAFATHDGGADAATTAPVTSPGKAAPPASATPIASKPAAVSIAPAASQVDFNRDVMPILSGNCFKCHGPDPDSGKAGLRLDHRDIATKPADSGETAIVPGKPDESELVAPDLFRRSRRADAAAGKQQGTDRRQKKTLRRWIAEGAEYEPHWSFVRAAASAAAGVKQTDWPRESARLFRSGPARSSRACTVARGRSLHAGAARVRSI